MWLSVITVGRNGHNNRIAMMNWEADIFIYTPPTNEFIQTKIDKFHANVSINILVSIDLWANEEFRSFPEVDGSSASLISSPERA